MALRSAPARCFLLALSLSFSSLCGCKPDADEAPRPEPSAGAIAPAPPPQPSAPPGPAVGPRMDALSGEDWNAAQIAWQPYESGLARAKEARKPVCLVFFTGWCPHCKAYSRVFEDPKVVEQAQKFVMIRLNADDEGDVAQKYAPDGGYIPRTFFLSPDGVLQSEIHATRDKFIYFYDERNPASLLSGMEAALRKLVK